MSTSFIYFGDFLRAQKSLLTVLWDHAFSSFGLFWVPICSSLPIASIIIYYLFFLYCPFIWSFFSVGIEIDLLFKLLVARVDTKLICPIKFWQLIVHAHILLNCFHLWGGVSREDNEAAYMLAKIALYVREEAHQCVIDIVMADLWCLFFFFF